MTFRTFAALHAARKAKAQKTGQSRANPHDPARSDAKLAGWLSPIKAAWRTICRPFQSRITRGDHPPNITDAIYSDPEALKARAPLTWGKPKPPRAGPDVMPLMIAPLILMAVGLGAFALAALLVLA